MPPPITAALIGPRTVEHVDEALAALDKPLAEDQLRALDELFPPLGRGGPAPDAWLT
ncbi:hypothetical protein [Actinoplanes sp. NPDC026619]|uniref:hypothetical protein n=1 Tax=Actinoplanes sp. NPDC026619 TaxID=3155798 RepID=UPI0033E47EBC